MQRILQEFKSCWVKLAFNNYLNLFILMIDHFAMKTEMMTSFFLSLLRICQQQVAEVSYITTCFLFSTCVCFWIRWREMMATSSLSHQRTLSPSEEVWLPQSPEVCSLFIWFLSGSDWRSRSDHCWPEMISVPLVFLQLRICWCTWRATVQCTWLWRVSAAWMHRSSAAMSGRLSTFPTLP